MAWHGMKSACRVGQNVERCLYCTISSPLPFGLQLVLVAMWVQQVWTVRENLCHVVRQLASVLCQQSQNDFQPRAKP